MFLWNVVGSELCEGAEERKQQYTIGLKHDKSTGKITATVKYMNILSKSRQYIINCQANNRSNRINLCEGNDPTGMAGKRTLVTIGDSHSEPAGPLTC